MKGQQLYINGMAVDMPAEEIKIKVESNILSDADKVMTAHSYTFTLPRTMRNDGIFKHAYQPNVETGGETTHTYLTAALFIDGLPLFDDGKAVLTKVDEKGYNLNLVWGLIGVFDIIKEEGLKLYELPLSHYWDESTMATWTQLAKNDALPYASGMDDAIYNTLDSDSKADVDTLPYKLSFFHLIGNTVDSILQKIQQVYGVTIELSAAVTNALKYLVYVPTSLRNFVDGETLSFSLNAALTTRYGERNFAWVPIVNTTPKYENTVVQTAGLGTQYTAKHKCVAKTIKVSGTASESFFVFTADMNTVYATQTPNGYTINQTFHDIEVEEGSNFLSISGDGTPSATATINVSATITIDDPANVVRGDWWGWERNYPDMTVMDFLSELMAHCNGVIVGSVTKPDHIKMVTFAEIAQATPQTVQMLGMSAVEMSLNDLAQRNNYVHKDNDDTIPVYNASGVIYTNDSTIKVDRDAFKSNFKVSRSSLVKLFDVEKNDNNNNYKARWTGSGDYLGVYNTDEYIGTAPAITGVGADFLSIIASRYIDYEGVVKHPKVIEITTRMTLIDLLKFDMAKPVNVPQLGRNYLVVSLEGMGNDEYKLRLIQI